MLCTFFVQEKKHHWCLFLICIKRKIHNFLPKNFQHFWICYTIIVQRDRELLFPLVLFVTIGSSLKKKQLSWQSVPVIFTFSLFKTAQEWAVFLSFHSRKPHPMKSGGDECVLFSFYIFSFWFFKSLLLDILF